MSNLLDNKFKDQKVTADGSNRAFIEARNIKTLGLIQVLFAILSVEIVI